MGGFVLGRVRLGVRAGGGIHGPFVCSSRILPDETDGVKECGTDVIRRALRRKPT